MPMITILAVLGVLLGGFSALTDLTCRLGGSYSRSPLGTLARALLIVGFYIILVMPLFLIASDPSSKMGNLLLRPFGLCGFLIFLHFLFPYRCGIRKLRHLNTASRKTPLTREIFLHETSVDLAGFPAGLDRLTCLVIADLHCNTRKTLALMDDVLSKAAGESFDFVFVLGDLGENQFLLPEIICRIGSLSARFGIFAVRGNHDFEGGRSQIIQELAQREGISLLPNEAQEISEIDATIAGIERPWHKTDLPDRVDPGFAIGLSHSPDNISAFRRLGVDLVLAAHTHGGRFRIPGLGPLVVPSRHGRFLDRGWFRQGETSMFVTVGFGDFPGTLGRTGEILKLTIKAGQ